MEQLEKEEMRIPVTFKKTEKKLYLHAKKHSSPAAFIKDLIRNDMDRGETKTMNQIVDLD